MNLVLVEVHFFSVSNAKYGQILINVFPFQNVKHLFYNKIRYLELTHPSTKFNNIDWKYCWNQEIREEVLQKSNCDR